MSIVLVRHGETAGNARRVVQPPETPLNERGIAQAQSLAQRLLGLSLGKALCSDLERARMTAQPVADAGVSVEYTPLLQERNFGDHRGTPYAELNVDLFAEDYEPPNGESWGQFHERVEEAWRHILQAHRTAKGNLLVVSHGLFCVALARVHLHVEGEVPGRWGNTSVTVIEPEPPFRVRLLNCTAHLPGAAMDDESAIAGI